LRTLRFACGRLCRPANPGIRLNRLANRATYRSYHRGNSGSITRIGNWSPVTRVRHRPDRPFAKRPPPASRRGP